MWCFRYASLGWEISSAIVSLVIAVVGVCGTLASAIFTQGLSQRARLEELGRTERLRLADQEAAENKSKTDQLRSCYVQLNANDRNYRDAMLAYAYALKAGSPAKAEAKEMTAARRAQRNARAEAQMIVSEEVLDSEGRVNLQLTPPAPEYAAGGVKQENHVRLSTPTQARRLAGLYGGK